jgi:hypothetical protein
MAKVIHGGAEHGRSEAGHSFGWGNATITPRRHLI